MRRVAFLVWILLSLGASSAQAAPVVRTATGANAPAIQATVDQFRNDLGTLNANTGGSKDTGRREINWDDIQGSTTKVTTVAPDTYNSGSPRGVFLLTDGSGFGVSENPGVAPTLPNGLGGYANFSSMRQDYASTFDRFSGERIFTPLGSTTTGALFLLPGAIIPARSSGFGAVFTDVDTGATKIEYYRADGTLLHAQPVPAQDGGVSFAGVSFTDGSVIAAVKITSGAAPLSANNADSAVDVVAMDDFIYGEPNDGDGVATASDNCPTLFNPDQKNTDGDGEGDVCDADDDNDGTPDAGDRLPGNSGETGDFDGDGIGDNSDPDDDNDGLPDDLEIYFKLNPRNADSDGDGKLDSTDNCPLAANADQADGNANGKGDACDPLDKTAPKVTSVKIRKKKFSRKKGTTITLRLDEPAAIAVTLERKKGNRYSKLKPPLSLLGKPGSNTVTIKRVNFKLLAVGSYRYSIVTADASNNISKAVTGTFKVTR